MSDEEQKVRYQLISPNLVFAPYDASDGVLRFELTAEEVRQPITDGVWMSAWGYNGSTPGPLLVCHEQDRIQVRFCNRLPEATAIHWRGMILPNQQDGVPMMSSGPYIGPGEEHVYEFTVREAGTFLYHAHVHNARQQTLGLGGMMVVLPLEREPVDKDFAVILQQWHLQLTSPFSALSANQLQWAKKNAQKRLHQVNPLATSCNYFTLNGRAFPDTSPLSVKSGDRVRIRMGNLGVQPQAMHLHGHTFAVTAVDGRSLVSPEWRTSVDVAPGQTVDIEFVADNPGVWAFHANNPQSLMNDGSPMGGMMTTLRYVDSEHRRQGRQG